MGGIACYFAAMPELLRSAKLAIEKGQAQGRNESYLKQLSDYIVPALVEALHKVIPPVIQLILVNYVFLFSYLVATMVCFLMWCFFSGTRYRNLCKYARLVK